MQREGMKNCIILARKEGKQQDGNRVSILGSKSSACQLETLLPQLPHSQEDSQEGPKF